MNIYLYDSIITTKAYDKIMARIETRITDLGLSGKIIRLNLMQSVEETIENEIKKGASTIVAVGSNKLFCFAMNAMAKMVALNLTNKKTPLGFIPIGRNNKLADFLGLSYETNACDTLSARRIEKFNLGQVNNYYFLRQAAITTDQTRLEIDDNYTLEFLEKGEVMIINLPTTEDQSNIKRLNAGGSNLGLFIKTQKSRYLTPLGRSINKSFFPFKKLRVYNERSELSLDEAFKIPLPVEVGSAKEKINLIIGKKLQL